jgi:hypothetical protein
MPLCLFVEYNIVPCSLGLKILTRAYNVNIAGEQTPIPPARFKLDARELD